MRNKLIIICGIIAICAACKKTKDTACYGLVAPVNAPENVSPIFPSFTWLNCTTMPSNIVLSAHTDFSKPIIDQKLFVNTLKADTILSPLTKYYWIITVFGNDESYIDSFTTSGVAGIIQGHYAGIGRNNNYAFIHDTTYNYELNVHDAGNDKISMQLPGIDTVVFSKLATTDSTIVYTCKPCTGKYSGFKNIVYHPSNKSVVITFQTSGFNYDEWDFTGYLKP